MNPRSLLSPADLVRDLPWRRVLGYSAFTLGVFLVSLLAVLPHDLIARRALAEATSGIPIEIRFVSVSFSFPSAYEFRDVQVLAPGDPLALASFPEIRVHVPVHKLLTARIDGIGFSGRIGGGTFEGDLEAVDGKIVSRIEARRVDLGTLSRRLVPASASIGGQASFSLNYLGPGRLARDSRGTLEVRGTDLSLAGFAIQGIRLPDLVFAGLDLDANLEGTRLTIEKFRARSDELKIDGDGDILVRDPVTRSVLNLKIGIEVDEKARPGLRMATAFLPKRTGSQDRCPPRHFVKARSYSSGGGNQGTHHTYIVSVARRVGNDSSAQRTTEKSKVPHYI